MQGIVDALITVVGWSIVFATAATSLRDRTRPAFFLWLFLVLFSVSFTLQIDPLYIAIDAALPINNLAWWLSYVAITIALAFMVVGCRKFANIPSLPVEFLVILTTLATGIIYVLRLSHAPESLAHDYPRSAPEVFFIAIQHVYDVVMLIAGPIAAFSSLWRRETLLAGRLRVAMFFLASISGLIWQILKLIRVGLIIPMGDAPLVLAMPRLFPLPLAVVVVTLILAFLPQRAYGWLTAKVEYMGLALALLQGRWLALQLEPLWRPLALRSVPLSIQLRRPSLYLRRQTYYILDCQRALAADRPLEGALQSLPIEAEYDEIVKASSRISRQLFARRLMRMVKHG